MREKHADALATSPEAKTLFSESSVASGTFRPWLDRIARKPSQADSCRLPELKSYRLARKVWAR